MLFNYINTLCKHISSERTLEMMALWLSGPLGLLLGYSNKTGGGNQGHSPTVSPSLVSVHLYASVFYAMQRPGFHHPLAAKTSNQAQDQAELLSLFCSCAVRGSSTKPEANNA